MWIYHIKMKNDFNIKKKNKKKLIISNIRKDALYKLYEINPLYKKKMH